MKNIATLSIIFLCLLLIGFGVYQKLQPANNQETAVTEQQAAVTATTVTPVTPTTNGNLLGDQPVAVTAAATPKVDASGAAIPTPTRYYPDQGSVSASGGGSDASAVPAGSTFGITPELIAKMHLVDKYKPGVCYGQAVAVPAVAISGMIDYNKDLAQFLRQKYSLKTDLEVYTKIKQLNAVMLTETASSKYNFTFTDGQCCTKTLYSGTVEVSGSTATDIVTSQESRSEQC